MSALKLLRLRRLVRFRKKRLLKCAHRAHRLSDSLMEGLSKEYQLKGEMV